MRCTKQNHGFNRTYSKTWCQFCGCQSVLLLFLNFAAKVVTSWAAVLLNTLRGRVSTSGETRLGVGGVGLQTKVFETGHTMRRSPRRGCSSLRDPWQSQGAPAAVPSSGHSVPFKGQCLPEAHGQVLHCIQLCQVPQGHRETMPCHLVEHKAEARVGYAQDHACNSESGACCSLHQRLGCTWGPRGRQTLPGRESG